MRKYSGLMIVVLVVVFISFFFMDTSSMRAVTGATNTVMKIDGRSYSDKDFRHEGSGAYDVIVGTAQAGDFGLYQAFIPLFGRAGNREDVPRQLFVGRALLHDAQDEFGIHPSDDEVSSYIRKMRIFAGPDNAFSQENYRNFVEKHLIRLGLGENDLRSLVTDAIVAQKLQAIVGSGLAADRNSLVSTLALDNQSVTAELARLDLDTFQDKIEPTEEQIKTYWESIQDSFKTDPLRKFTYVIVTPPATADSPDEVKESLAEAAASDEAKAAAKKAADDKKAAAAAKTAEERRKKQIATDALVDDFLTALQDQKGIGFEDLAKKYNWEVKTSELFSLANPPADLNVDLRSTSTAGKAAAELFKIKSDSSDPLSKISAAIPIGDGQWLVARLDGEEKARVKTFAEARGDARAQYISEKGIEALKAATEQAATKIKEALTAGKSFADAAKDAGIPEVKTVEKINSSYRPDAITEPQNLFETVRLTDPGSIASTVVESDRAFIVYVAKREVVKEPNAEARITAEIKSRATENQMAAFDSWLTARIESAKVEDLYKKN